MKVSEVMTREVLTVPPQMSLRDLALLLGERRISGVPVVGPGEIVMGVVSEADILAKARGPRATRASALAWLFGDRTTPDELRRRAATTVGEAMTTPAVTVEADRPLREAASLMLDRGVNRLPVMSGDLLVGIITRADLVRAYVRRDQEALTEIRDVVRTKMWLDPDDMLVEVHEGEAHIAGGVDRRSTAEILERLIAQVDGVDTVVNDLRWELDDSQPLPAGEADVSRARPR